MLGGLGRGACLGKSRVSATKTGTVVGTVKSTTLRGGAVALWVGRPFALPVIGPGCLAVLRHPTAGLTRPVAMPAASGHS
jgi:hypothetical protein